MVVETGKEEVENWAEKLKNFAVKHSLTSPIIKVLNIIYNRLEQAFQEEAAGREE